MTLKKVALTGSEGTVGRVLTGRSLAEGDSRPVLHADITRIDVKPDKGDSEMRFVQSDLQDPDLIREMLATHDVVIHGAWNAQEGVLRPDFSDPDNILMAQRIFRAAEELGEHAVAKIIMLSSVNAHVPVDWRERREHGNYISVDETPQPYRHNRGGVPGGGATRYGESKVAIEHMARRASQRGAHVVVPRLGGVNLRDKPSSKHEAHQAIYNDPDRGRYFDAQPGGWEDAVRLRHSDLIQSIQQLVDEPKWPGVYEQYNLVSDTADRVHQLPQDKKE